MMAKKANKRSLVSKSAAAPPTRLQARGGLPTSYPQLLDEIKSRIAQARVRAALSVNRELIRLYWEIGRLIVERQENERWGSHVIDRLAADVQAAFPGIEGFSPRNFWHMRSFYLAYTGDRRKLKQPVSESDGENLPQAVSEIPWGHNIVLLQRLWAKSWRADDGPPPAHVFLPEHLENVYSAARQVRVLADPKSPRFARRSRWRLSGGR